MNDDCRLPALRSLGSRVRFARNGTGLSQKDFARKLGAGQHYLSDMERDVKHPSEKMLRKIAEASDVPVEWLAYGDLGLAGTRPDGPAVTVQELDRLLAGIRWLERAVLDMRLKIDRQHAAAVTEDYET